MKIIIYILFFFFPIVAFAQQPQNNASPMSYAWQYVGNPNFSYPLAGIPSLFFSPTDNQAYVAYGSIWWWPYAGATVKKFNGTNWEAVGDTEFSAGGATGTSLAFSQSGQPYVAYTDYANAAKATVMKFDGNNWVNVGNPGLSQGGVNYPSLAFSPSDNHPYVAFMDSAVGYQPNVMKFDGSNWVAVGNAGLTWTAKYINLAFNPSDSQPYVAFTDLADRVIVMKFNGSNWLTVGNAGFSGGNVFFTSLAFSPTGEPYVAYMDTANSGKASVMKFDGTTWVYVGNEGFSSTGASYTCLAFNPVDGQPYVLFYAVDYPNYFGATLMKFNGADWVYVGTPGFSNGEANNGLSLAFNTQGQPYAAYGDGHQSYQISVMKYDSVLVNVNEPKELPFRYYPNPTSDLITVDFTDIIGSVKSVEIDNFSGVKLVENSTLENKMNINVKNLSCGIYLLKVKTKNSCYFKKICKI